MRVVRGFKEGMKALERRGGGTWEQVSPKLLEGIRRLFGEPLTPRQVVARILADVRRRGDEAVREYTRLVDHVELRTLELPASAWHGSLKQVPSALRRAMETAAERIEAFHRVSLPRSWVDFAQGFGELFIPMERVGIYAPGGTAAYPSSVLMTAIPARVAGVREVILASPARGDAGPHPLVLAAADLAGVDRVFQIGGAQAIAALAYGTESVPKVDMVCGPGNIFVTLAKQMVYGDVAVDGLYGPTETVVIADDSAKPALCAADLLGQAEHDILASPVFITTSETLLARVQQELAKQLEALPRKDIARHALETNGVAVLVKTMEEAVELGNAYAPEHMCLLARDPWPLVGRVRNAGGLFLGEASPEAMGDYVAGPSHVMPTGGTARFASPLGVHQFLKVTALVALDEKTSQALARPAAAFARAEGFDGHARAIEARWPRRRPPPRPRSIPKE